MLERTETLADRLNYEPIIFRGSTSTELLMIVIAGGLFWLPFGFLIAGLFGALSMGVGVAAVGVIATVYFGSTVFQMIKRGKPDYYYQQRVWIRLQRLKLISGGLTLRSGTWDLGRNGHGYRIDE
jgi:conjugative transfer region protein (TIGR03750 family)